MRDINFFSVYSKRRGSALRRSMSLLLIVAVVFAIIGGAYLILYRHCRNIENEAQEIADYLSSDEVISTLAAVERYTDGNKVLDSYESIVDEIIANLNETNYLPPSRMDALSAALPADVVLDDISVSGYEAEMDFTVPDVAVSAQLAVALSDLPFFESVEIGDVSGARNSANAADTSYSVSVSAILKGGDVE